MYNNRRVSGRDILNIIIRYIDTKLYSYIIYKVFFSFKV